MAVTWTKEQKQVIDSRDESLLVSAAAGSGKTAVLTARILSMVTDPEHPVDIDRILVVTFTKAAAAQMRERIAKALSDALQEEPGNLHLKRQSSLIHHAQITTIDSFCLSVVRNHFHAIDLEPGFRSMDEGEATLLKEDVIEEVLESFYEKGEDSFLKFAANYGGTKSDDAIREMVLSLFQYASSYPWPYEWLDACLASCTAETAEELYEKPWMKSLFSFLRSMVKGQMEKAKHLKKMCSLPAGPYVYDPVFESDLALMERLLEADGLEEWVQALSSMKFMRLPTPKKDEKGDPDLQEKVKNGRNKIKDALNKLVKYLPCADSGQALMDLAFLQEMVRELITVTKAFMERFQEKKAEKNLVDFSDMEHFALEVLLDPVTHDPTRIAEQYQEQFAEIMIDEYQDSNHVQEALLYAVSKVSRGVENRFMVGDVKQSIYRFRQARPELFMEKFHTFHGERPHCRRIDLHRNFRSRQEVVDFTNQIFYAIMKEDIGRIEYDEESALYAGADTSKDPAADYKTEILTVEKVPSAEAARAEAAAIAQRIRRMIEQNEIPGLTYEDIVILMRSPRSWAPIFQEVFSDLGIPLSVESKSGYFSALEVQQILSFLRVLDNPMQDIPLAASMRAHFGGFSSDELAQIRAAASEGTFYQAVLSCAVEEPVLKQKVETFLNLLDSFRDRVSDTPIHELIQMIYKETGFYNHLAALPAGAQRTANLDMLLTKAIAYEQTSYQGLMHFIRYIDRLHRYEVDFGEAQEKGGSLGAVRLLSIHQSKGLEFPVVFVAQMGRQFNQSDQKNDMILHPEYGIGLKIKDRERHIKKNSLIRQALLLEEKKETLGEELLILYVAFTRAEKKLILMGSVKELPEEDISMDFASRFQAACYYDLVLPVAAAYGFSPVMTDQEAEEERIGRGEQQTLANIRKAIAEPSAESERMREILDERFSWRYPKEAERIPKQKVSVSELKHRAMEQNEIAVTDIDAKRLIPEEVIVPYRPSFIEKSEDVYAGALYGTAIHRVLECVDYSRFHGHVDEADLKMQLDELKKDGRLEEELYERINIQRLLIFLNSEAGLRMQAAAGRGELFREQPFAMTIPADRVWVDAPHTETVLTQGIIDAFWREEDGIVLLDYKTDRVDAEEELLRRYRVQLLLYREALNRRFPDTPVKEVLIYSLYLGRAITVE